MIAAKGELFKTTQRLEWHNLALSLPQGAVLEYVVPIGTDDQHCLLHLKSGIEFTIYGRYLEPQRMSNRHG